MDPWPSWTSAAGLAGWLLIIGGGIEAHRVWRERAIAAQADLDELVDRTRAAGFEVSVRTMGERRVLPPAVDVGSGSAVAVVRAPVVPLLVIVVLDAIAGALAGWRPSRRAARVDVLDAIASA